MFPAQMFKPVQRFIMPAQSRYSSALQASDYRPAAIFSLTKLISSFSHCLDRQILFPAPRTILVRLSPQETSTMMAVMISRSVLLIETLADSLIRVWFSSGISVDQTSEYRSGIKQKSSVVISVTFPEVRQKRAITSAPRLQQQISIPMAETISRSASLSRMYYSRSAAE